MSTFTRQTRFELTLMGNDQPFSVLAFKGEEAISEPFSFDIELVSERASLDLDALLHQPAWLSFSPRHGIHGQIERITRASTGKRLTHYSLTLVPRLAYLAHRTNHRIFQRLTVQQIIGQVLKEHGIFNDAYVFAGFSDYPARDYCVQYGESDLHFIQRLCFEEGFHYYFKHASDSHVLVFGDKQQAFTPLKAPTPYVPGSGMVAQGPAVNDFQMSLHACTNSTFTRDYDFEKAGRTLEAASHSPSRMRPLERYSYPGHFTREQEGKRHSLRLQGAWHSNDGEIIRRWAVAGHGYAYKSLLDIGDDLRAGRLQTVLDDYFVDSVPLHLLYRRSRFQPPRVALLADFLLQQFAALQA